MKNRSEVRKEIRKRMFEQSTHLSNRTNNFLLASSILIAGTQFNKFNEIPFWLLISGFLIALLWLLTSLQTKAIIKNLSIDYHKDDNVVDKLIEEKKFPVGLRPTDIFSVYIPGIFLFLWILLFCLRVSSIC